VPGHPGIEGRDRKKALGPAARRELVDYGHKRHGVSKRRACKLFGIRESVYYYTPLQKDDGKVREALAELAEVNTRWGFWMMHYRLRELGHEWNHKKVYRIYTEMGLNLRRTYKRRLPSRVKEPLVQPLYANLTWSMDFMQDGLNGGISFRSFNVIDDFNREALNITIDRSINSKRVVRELDRLIEWRGRPKRLRVDNGPEFVARAVRDWCDSNAIELKFIQKGKPSQNGYVERFNRTYRTEVLDCYAFETMEQAKVMTSAWMWMYNNERPHGSLAYNAPTKFALKYGYLKREIPTFQHDISIDNNDWKSLVLNTTKTG
jgi:putative transposase